MTHPLVRNRVRMMTGCGSAALALGLMLASGEAAAQGIQAEGQVVFGGAEIFSLSSPTGSSTVVEANTPAVVIDWTPFEDANGNAFDFLPNGNEAIFQNAFGLSNFAVLNRILPSTNGSVVVINGSVISRIQDFSSSFSGGVSVQPASGHFTPGGFVAFYSPTGFLIGSTATFDVGNLLLTTLDATPENFADFAASGGTLNLAAQQGSTASIRIESGAQINGLSENSFFAAVAADVRMSGTSRVNGSQAYVAGEVVNLRFSNGLFDIEVPVGTAKGGTVLELDGIIGGPASTGSLDNHVIYGVAAAQADPITMLLSGNIGFEPALQAGIVNGEIILSANYDVTGRSVNGGSTTQGLDASFGLAGAPTGAARADIRITNVTATSGLTAVSSHLARLSAIGGNSTIGGNLLLAGREAAEVRIGAGDALAVAGDLLVSADAYGSPGGSQVIGLPGGGSADATGGAALIEVLGGGLLSVDGSVRVSADAYAGADSFALALGSATGGSARIIADGAIIEIGGTADLSARGIGVALFGAASEGTLRGGTAEIDASNGADVTIGSNLALAADAFARSFGAAQAGSVFGGTARLGNTGATITVTGNAFLGASASAGGADAAASGALADAGTARVLVEGGGLTTIRGLLSLSANASGGYNFGGTGGEALGGVALAVTRGGGRLDVGDEFSANAEAFGGFGEGGGTARGGVAGAIAETGRIDLRAGAVASAFAFGGDAFIGNGARGGDGFGGTAVFRADGTLTQTAALVIGNGAIANADGTGGEGGRTDGTIRGGRGGDGRGGSAGLANQADPGFVGGAYILAGGDNGTLTTGALSNASARGLGGEGGDYSTFDPDQTADDAGDGGNGFGGTAQVGTALRGTDGSLRAGAARLSGIVVDVEGRGGNGGRDESDGFIAGTGNGLAGNGTGGAALLSAGGGVVTTSSLDLRAAGSGGSSSNGGFGQGGRAAVFGEAGGTISVGTAYLDAAGQGGFGDGGAGGGARGGDTAIILDGMDATFNGITSLTAIGFGGSGTVGNGGDGRGGTAFIGQQTATRGNGTLNAVTLLEAHGRGGGAGLNATSGAGRGGAARVQALGGSTLRFRALSVSASGAGGESEGRSSGTQGGDGFGGSAELRSGGSGSQIIVETNDIGEFGGELTGGAVLAALGLGGQSTGGTGVGGRGNGGTILVSAASGGAITLPADPLSPGALRLLAYGLGGGSLVDGGTGGAGLAGSGTIEAAGGTIVMGTTEFSIYGRGGSSLDSALGIGGGRGDGGTRLIRVTDGGMLTGEFSVGTAGGFGGTGTGGRNGGAASTGTSTISVTGGTFNVIGRLLWTDTSTGGDGAVGGNVAAKAGDVAEVAIRGDNALITFTANGKGETGLVAGASLTGGNGVSAGGNVSAGLSVIDLRQTTLTGGNIQLQNLAVGGAASGSGGIGGNAAASRIDFLANGSTIGLSGVNVISSTARGGASASGNGGSAVNGLGQAATVNVALTGSAVTIVSAQSAPGGLTIASRAFGGAGTITGNAFARAAGLGVNGGNLSLGVLSVQSQASATAEGSGQAGGAAASGVARIALSGTGQLAATIIAVNADAQSSLGGTSAAGEAQVALAAGSQAAVFASDMNLSANATGGGPNGGSNLAGRFALTAASGTLELGGLRASALGDALAANAPASQISATGGASLLVGSVLSASALGDVTLANGQGGTIGNTAASANATMITVDAGGTIRVVGDGSAGSGLGGQSLSLIAGRSILLDGNLFTRSGTAEFAANRNGAATLAQPSPSVITMGQGSSIDAGTGTVSFSLFDGEGDPQRATGAITLARVTGGVIDARNYGSSAGSDIRVTADGVLTASGSGRAIDLAALNGEVINLAGDAGLILTGTGHYGIFAATPAGSQIGSFANYARRYNVASASAYDELNPGGNFAAFRLAPVLTVSAADAARFYGNSNPVFTASFAGFQPGDSAANLTGAAQFSTLAGLTSGIGQYAIDITLGTLLSEQGYRLVLGNPGVLTVTPRALTITANNLSRIYGDANPALTFTLGGLGLVNGDQLTGALATTAGAITGVGNFAITQGTLAASANYVVSFNPGILSITPRALTITANNLSRIYGDANPALTFTLGGLGLVNGDQLTGALATTAGAITGVGNFAITQGTLAASANYVVSFNPGILSITPRALTITANNLSRIYGDANPALTFTLGGLGLVNGDQLTGALATTAGATTGVGNVAITQGTLAASANYVVTYNTGILTITPRPITVTADNLSKLLGLRDPALTFAVSGAGLVNGDQLTGALMRDAGERVGTFAIRQGTLAASANYTVTYVGGTLTIDQPPTPPGLENPTTITPQIVPDEPPPPPASEEDDAFGMDFPEQPDAALIAGDALLDDPVASGNDALVNAASGDEDDEDDDEEEQ